MTITTPRKLEAILAYFTNNTDTRYLGKVKLMKLFYYLDFTHVRGYGVPVTYDTYYNLEHGPIPTTIKDLADSFEKNPEGHFFQRAVTCEHPKNTKMCRFLPAREFTEQDAGLFTASELEVLKAVCEKYKDTTTDQIEAESHSEAPWSATKYTQRIPYSLAARDKDSKVSEADIELALALY